MRPTSTFGPVGTSATGARRSSYSPVVTQGLKVLILDDRDEAIMELSSSTSHKSVLDSFQYFAPKGIYSDTSIRKMSLKNEPQNERHIRLHFSRPHAAWSGASLSQHGEQVGTLNRIPCSTHISIQPPWQALKAHLLVERSANYLRKAWPLLLCDTH